MSCIIYISDYIDQIYKCKISRKYNVLCVNICDNDKSKHVQSHESITLHLTSWQLQLCLTDFVVCPNYRQTVIRYVAALKKCVLIKIVPPAQEIIDYSWNKKTRHTTWQKVEMDNIMSWLSTLGGAFSALGDSFENCAQIAGKISVYQLKLALSFGDPLLICRCLLYYSLSLMQKGYLRQAKYLIRQQYEFAKSVEEYDDRLCKMCHGIWMKLQYSYTIRKKKRLEITDGS